MPSPIGHALGGALVGGLVVARRAPAVVRRPLDRWIGSAARGWRLAVVLGLAATLPDLDLLVGLHSRYTHSVGAALAVGTAAWLASRRDWRFAAAVTLAYASHVLFDTLSNDTSPPIGIMALWPFSSRFYQSAWHVFVPISRRYWLPGFLAHNLRAVVWEVLLLGPLTLWVWWGGRKTTR